MVLDFHQNVILCVILLLVPRSLGISIGVRKDALMSVERAFRLGEWRALAGRAGLRYQRIWLYYGSRIVLQAWKQG